MICKPLGGLAGFPGCYNNLLCHEIPCPGCAMQPLQPNKPVAQQLQSCFLFIQIKLFPCKHGVIDSLKPPKRRAVKVSADLLIIKRKELLWKYTMSHWGLRSLYYLDKIQVRPTVGDIRYSCFSVQTALSFLPTQLPADSFTSHAGIMPQVLGGAHVPGTELEEMLQLPASSRAVLAGPAGAGGLYCCLLSFCFYCGTKGGKGRAGLWTVQQGTGVSTSLTVSKQWTRQSVIYFLWVGDFFFFCCCCCL